MWESPPQGYFHHSKMNDTDWSSLSENWKYAKSREHWKVTVTAEQNDNQNIKTLNIVLSKLLQLPVALQPVEVKKYI